MTALCDTNLLVDPFDTASPVKQGRSRQVFSARAQRNAVLPSTKVLEGVRIVNPFRAAAA